MDHLPKKMFIWGVELEVAENKMKKGFEIANQVYEKIEDKSSLLLPVEMYLSPFDFNQKISQFVKFPIFNKSRSIKEVRALST